MSCQRPPTHADKGPPTMQDGGSSPTNGEVDDMLEPWRKVLLRLEAEAQGKPIEEKKETQKPKRFSRAFELLAKFVEEEKNGK